MWSSQAVKDYVRMLHPGFDLRHIMTWKTRILFIKKMKKGSFIGYNRTYQATRDMQMAILPVGYYDGYDFRFSNRTKVYVRGVAVPVVGRVCMNQTMVDVTDCPDVAVHDEVTLLGNDEHITVYDIAQLSARENIREITSTLRHDIPRILAHSSTQAYEAEPLAVPLERDISLI
jgi:alanine racemase